MDEKSKPTKGFERMPMALIVKLQASGMSGIISKEGKQ